MTNEQSKPKLMNRNGAAEYLGIKPPTLAGWASRGTPEGYPELPFFKVGKVVRYRISDLDAFIEAGMTCVGSGNSA